MRVPTKRSRSREKPEQIADELRALIVSGELADGESLGREPDLVERFGVSRPSLREALRILEAEGLITVVRGVLGGVIVNQPNERMTARTAALVLQSRNVTLGDVHQARSVIEPAAVGILAASSPRRKVARRAAVARRGAARRDRRSRSLRPRQRRVPRAAGRARREPDVEHRGRDAQRDRGARGHRGEPDEAATPVTRSAAAGDPVTGAVDRAPRDPREHRGRSALARAHEGGGEGHDRPAGDNR